MKRCINALCIFCILFSSFTLLASAHPGRTDSNGGHYDHDTGEYHYHTGEYAGLHQSSDGNSSYNNSNTYDRVYENGYNGDYRPTYNELSVEDKEENNQKFKSLFHEVVDWIYAILVFAPWVLGIGYLLWAFALSPIIDKLKSKTYKPDIEHLCNNIDKTDSPSFLTIGKDIDSGLYRIIPSSSTKTQIIIRYPKNNSDSYTEKVFTHKSITLLRKGYEIKLINCSLSKLIMADEDPQKRQQGFLKNQNEINKNPVTNKDIHTNKFENVIQVEPNASPQNDILPPKISTVKKSESLIPIFIPPEAKSKTEHNKNFSNKYFIGSDIPAGTYLFSPKDHNTPAFFTSRSYITNITKPKQRFFLAEGEHIFLFNCYLESEE